LEIRLLAILYYSGLYPNSNRISTITKRGAAKVYNKLSSRAGALFSKTPCPINYAIQLTIWI
jgi:hypothetical protein